MPESASRVVKVWNSLHANDRLWCRLRFTWSH